MSLPLQATSTNSIGGDIDSIGQEAKEAWSEISPILEKLMSSELQNDLFMVKLVFIIVTIVFFLFIIYFISKSDYLKWLFLYNAKSFTSKKSQMQKKLAKNWERVRKEFDRSKIESQWKLSLIEALELFNEGLRRSGFFGNTLREKLEKIAKGKMPEIEKVYPYVEKCESLLQNPDQYVDRKDAENIIKVFELVLKKLEFL